MSGLVTIDEALARVLARVEPLASEHVPITAAAGRVLAADGVAATDLPPFDSSAMDGYAVRAADTPGPLGIVGESAAGRPAATVLEAGQAIAISTGAVVPVGADAVVPVELTERDDSGVVTQGVASGENVRPRGGDAAAGTPIVVRGARLGPAQIGALAAGGVSEVICARNPSVSVLVTGDELRAPGGVLAPGEIFESNSAMLAAQVASAGAQVVRSDRAVDDEADLRAALARCLDADVLITSGGVSVGPHDLVRTLLAEAGVAEVVWGVSVRPGKPFYFGVGASTLVFGLPGNPVSALVGFELFVRPALAALQGAAPGPHFQPGLLAAPVRRNVARDELIRAQRRIEGDLLVLDPLQGRESHMIVRAAPADALVLVPHGEGELAAGSAVRYLPV